MNTCFTIYDKIKNICNCQYNFFLQKNNVVGIGLGYKIINGCTTNQLCIIVYVTQKLPSNLISSDDVIPKCYCGIPTDVIESGYVSVGTCNCTSSNCTCPNSPLKHRLRPCTGGFSIGIDGAQDCSLGCLVRDPTNEYYILTCNHGVARNSEWSIGVNQVVQQAPNYGGRSPRDTIAKVSKFQKVNMNQGEVNSIDAAICETNVSMVAKGLYNYGNINGVEQPIIGTKVAKVGAGTDITTGTIVSLASIVKIYFLGHEVLFRDQIITNTKVNRSDEGALLIDKKTHAALGLIMGQTEKITVCNDISEVLNSLGVSIVQKY